MTHADPRPDLAREGITIPAGHRFARLPWIGLALAVVGLGCCVVFGQADVRRFLFSWLVAYLFFLSLGLGGVFFVLIQFATKAGWSVAVRRIAENLMATVPVFAVLFLPILFGAPHLYHWWHHEAMAADALLRWKQPYLNGTFFLVRAALYFACWSLIAVAYLRASRRQDLSGDHAITRRLQRWSGPAIIGSALTVTFAAVDWIMSLEPHWYSTIFGVYFFSGCLVGGFAFLAVVAIAMRRAGLLRGVVTIEHLHDLGKLLFAFTCFWSYIAFSQYFLMWYANIPEETIWYAHRLEGSWRTASVALALGHFIVPFFFLLPRTIKRRESTLLVGSLWMLLVHLLDIYWLVMPTVQHGRFVPRVMDAAALLAVGGLFLAAFGRLLRSGALLPVRDPRLAESLSFENV